MKTEEQLVVCNDANLNAVEHNNEEKQENLEEIIQSSLKLEEDLTFLNNLNKNEEILEKTEENLEKTKKIEINNENCSKNLQTGSSKFKSVEALQEAYNNLEKEFTKKCQALNKLIADNNEKEKLPAYNRENWQQKVDEFLTLHPTARSFTKQIAEVLTKNTQINHKEDALNLAYSIVLENNYKTGEQLANDNDFLEEFVFKNEKIKNKIIDEYLNNISQNKIVPLISNASGSLSVTSPKFKPKNLSEAGLYAQHILKK